MKATAKRIEKMEAAIAAMEETREAAYTASQNMTHEYETHELSDGTKINILTEETRVSCETYLAACEAAKKTQKKAIAAVKSCAESLGLTIKSKLRYNDEIKSTAIRLKARYEAAMEALHHISRYDDYIATPSNEYGYTF